MDKKVTFIQRTGNSTPVFVDGILDSYIRIRNCRTRMWEWEDVRTENLYVLEKYVSQILKDRPSVDDESEGETTNQHEISFETKMPDLVMVYIDDVPNSYIKWNAYSDTWSWGDVQIYTETLEEAKKCVIKVLRKKGYPSLKPELSVEQVNSDCIEIRINGLHYSNIFRHGETWVWETSDRYICFKKPSFIEIDSEVKGILGDGLRNENIPKISFEFKTSYAVRINSDDKIYSDIIYNHDNGMWSWNSGDNHVNTPDLDEAKIYVFQTLMAKENKDND